MKKVENVQNGLPGCVKTRPLANFPQIIFGLFSLMPPNKFTMKEGEECIISPKLNRKHALSCNINSDLTLHKIKIGGKNENEDFSPGAFDVMRISI
jgi:hypothetical protein